MAKQLKSAFLKAKKVPKILWVGFLTAAATGWVGWTGLTKVTNYYQFRAVFPTKTEIIQAIDGDTVELKNGLSFRLLGINAPDRGDPKYIAAGYYLNDLVEGKTASIEYDTYQDDKYGRILGYLFLPCDSKKASALPTPKAGSQQGDALTKYCRNGRALVNEILVKEGYAVSIVYQDRRPLKYATYLLVTPSPTSQPPQQP